MYKFHRKQKKLTNEHHYHNKMPMEIMQHPPFSLYRNKIYKKIDMINWLLEVLTR